MKGSQENSGYRRPSSNLLLKAGATLRSHHVAWCCVQTDSENFQGQRHPSSTIPSLRSPQFTNNFPVLQGTNMNAIV